ncbi:alkylation response protein AidB-like acyl-CoA dehydrogenase [Actinocorallia herbida]|uniref:Alkylation response protein AidB-like acyl-CoA dehydrogenase n=1 Tax=Actinocorallia herbida TaxID=58109 RepID=A0A3N1CZ97_9ACTN|nr:acyl-CoA dehydrogenase family protein [Actinocorallia herbida]ROO86572.1 alkylation response protein AidB-like acyl-CoA dehydrogenase [Actinocorallia herbida]
MTDTTMESVESFRLRARAWLAAHMPRRDAEAEAAELPEDDIGDWLRARELQQLLYSGGFAGICFPKEYDGLGLTPAHQLAFNEESAGYEMPLALNLPSFAICAATILDCGTEEQKRDRIGGAIRGEEILCQFLSEPSGGSDLAGLITRADRDGDDFVINGSKTWSTSAYAADWALCLARTNWDVPKHRGLTMFLMPTKAPGITMNRVRMVNGSLEFCDEFFDNVVLPASAVVGEVDGGWAVASRQLFHERNSMGGGSPYVSGQRDKGGMSHVTPFDVAAVSGRSADPRVREMVGRSLVMEKVAEQTATRVTRGIASGALPPTAASLLRLLHAEYSQLNDDLAVRIAGSRIGFGEAGGQGPTGRASIGYLMRQGGSLGGGSTEMARNVISERVLGMPREAALDRDVPFNQVKRGR